MKKKLFFAYMLGLPDLYDCQLALWRPLQVFCKRKSRSQSTDFRQKLGTAALDACLRIQRLVLLSDRG